MGESAFTGDTSPQGSKHLQQSKLPTHQLQFAGLHRTFQLLVERLSLIREGSWVSLFSQTRAGAGARAGLWFMVYGLWLMVYGLWLVVYGSWFMVYDFMVDGVGFGV